MSEVAVASYLSCTGIFAIVTIILSLHRPTRTQFPLLVLSCLATTIWGLLATVYAAGIINLYAPIIISETISNAAWYLCLIRLLKFTQRMKNTRWFLHPAFHAITAVLLLSLLASAFIPEFTWYPGRMGSFAHYTYFGNVLFTVFILALIEQVYRGSDPERRWGIKFLCIGLGLMYAYEFYFYANAALVNGISEKIWQVRGAISTVIAPLIALSALRHRKWRAELLPSRAVIFRSTVFLSCGIYLITMAFLGHGISHYSKTWGDVLQVVFFTGALIVLFLMLSSGRVRAWAKVFISKNFFKLRYDYRVEWIRFSSLLFANEDNRPLSLRVIKALADMVESPKGVLFEWEEGRGFVLKDCWNHAYPHREIVIDPCSFTDYLQQSQRAVELPARLGADERSFAFMSVPHILRQLNWAWLLVPLMQGNRLHGFVILAHPRTAFFNVNWEVLDLLSLAGRQAVICLVQEQNAQALAVARQFEGYNKVSTFVMHDLKNILAQLRLIQSNKEKHENNPAFVKSVFQTIEYNGDKIERLLLQMRGRQQEMGAQEVAIASALQKVIQLTNHRHPIPSLDWQLPLEEVLVKGEEDRFVNVLCHLVENAQQATPENGEVILLVTLKDEKLMIAVKDTGCGMDPEFLHFDLCKPFVTTKGEKGMGIGVFEAREYAHAIGGKLLVESVKGKGSTFNLEFPLKLALA